MSSARRRSSALRRTAPRFTFRSVTRSGRSTRPRRRRCRCSTNRRMVPVDRTGCLDHRFSLRHRLPERKRAISNDSAISSPNGWPPRLAVLRRPRLAVETPRAFFTCAPSSRTLLSRYEKHRRVILKPYRADHFEILSRSFSAAIANTIIGSRSIADQGEMSYGGRRAIGPSLYLTAV